MRLGVRGAGSLGAVLVALAIAVGAFGAHTLEGRLTEARLGTLETAVRYQTYGGLGLLVMAVTAKRSSNRTAVAVGRAATLLAVGLLFFCGALYLLVAGGPSFLGAVAPLGGAATIVSWLWLALALWREPVMTAP